MAARFFIIIAGLLATISCQDLPAPDLETISLAHCAIIQMCDPFDFEVWADLEACETYSADEFEAAKIDDRPCYDGRLAWETCMSMLEDCSEYEQYEQGQRCGEEFMEYYKRCRLP